MWWQHQKCHVQSQMQNLPRIRTTIVFPFAPTFAVARIVRNWELLQFICKKYHPHNPKELLA